MAVFAPDHHFDDLAVRLAAGLVGRDIAAIAEHRAFIGDLGDLMHAMGDIEERQTFTTQALEYREDFYDVGGGQCRGCFVENEDLGIAGKRLGDLDHLAP